MSDGGAGFDELDAAVRDDGFDIDSEAVESAHQSAQVSPIQDPRLSGQRSTQRTLTADDPRLQAARELLEGLSGRDLEDADPYLWVAAARKALYRFEELEKVATTGPDPIQDEATLLERYATIPCDEREETLSVVDQMAATIYENWTDIAWDLGTAEHRRYGLDTKTVANVKHNKREIMVTLEQLLDRDLQWKQIYDGMQAVAKHSGGEETTDRAGRLNIVGGEFVYHEKPTPDHSSVTRVLYRRDE